MAEVKITAFSDSGSDVESVSRANNVVGENLQAAQRIRLRPTGYWGLGSQVGLSQMAKSIQVPKMVPRAQLHVIYQVEFQYSDFSILGKSSKIMLGCQNHAISLRSLRGVRSVSGAKSQEPGQSNSRSCSGWIDMYGRRSCQRMSCLRRANFRLE
jgi:hypothetical protein